MISGFRTRKASGFEHLLQGMSRLFALLLLLGLASAPAAAFAANTSLDICDNEDEATCLCDPEDPSPYSGYVPDVETCQDYCTALADEDEDLNITGYSVQCLNNGVIYTADQGDLETIANALGDSLEEKVYADPILNVDIPGLSFTPAYSSGEVVVTNYLAEYLVAAYNWAIPAAALLAVVVLMIGGLQWMLARGDSGRIQKAKDRLRNATTGLVLLMGAYAMAYNVDPNLLSFNSLEITYIDPQEYIDQSPDTSGSYSPSASSVGVIAGDIDCDPSFSVAEIVQSSVGRVTYRYGGKGGDPPYTAETKVDADGVPYSTYCPEGTICLDCSGFADFVRSCAGMASAGESGGTSGIFDESAGAEVVEDWSSDGTINGVPLEPGDMIGRPGSHVLIYMGDGNIGDSHGSGRTPGDAIGIYSLSFAFDLYEGQEVYIRRR